MTLKCLKFSKKVIFEYMYKSWTLIKYLTLNFTLKWDGQRLQIIPSSVTSIITRLECHHLVQKHKWSWSRKSKIPSNRAGLLPFPHRY